MNNDQPVEFYRDAETGANRARGTMEVKITMSPEVAHLFDEAKRERERLQCQVDDMAELRALAEAVCTSPFTGYAVEVLVDWLESHPASHSDGGSRGSRTDRPIL